MVQLNKTKKSKKGSVHSVKKYDQTKKNKRIKVPKETRKINKPPKSFKPKKSEVDFTTPNKATAELVNKNYNKYRGYDLSIKDVKNFYRIPDNLSLEVRDSKTNRLVLSIRRKAIPDKMHEKVAEDWKHAAILTPNRGEAAGKADSRNITKYDRRFHTTKSNK